MTIGPHPVAYDEATQSLRFKAFSLDIAKGTGFTFDIPVRGYIVRIALFSNPRKHVKLGFRVFNANGNEVVAESAVPIIRQSYHVRQGRKRGKHGKGAN
jgi:hypothetical protein